MDQKFDEGKIKEKIDTVSRMMKKGYDLSEIAELTEISLDEINRIATGL